MKRLVSWFLLMILAFTLPGFALAQSDEEEIWSAVEAAYVYAFPLVIMDATKTAATNTVSPDNAGHAPVNQLIHSQRVANAQSKMVVTPNVDTVYTQSWLDIGDEPMIYVMPEADRFFNVQVLDAWTNTPALLEKAGVYVFTLPDWEGELPANAVRVNVPTEMVWLIARILVSGEADMPNVKTIQDGMKLMPLSAYESASEYLPGEGEYRAENAFVPIQAVLSMSMSAFFNTANRLMGSNPPSWQDAELLSSLEALGIGPGLSFDEERIPGDRPARWREMLTGLRAKLMMEGQRYSVALGQWKYFDAPIGNFGTAYAYRAMVALGGLGANTVDVAIYPKTNVDASGEVLSGEHTYVMHFDALPHTKDDGFWSVTAYGSDDFLMDNPLNRYCINDRSGVELNADGSLDIIISATEPETVSNWLPVGADAFHLYMRIYLPDMDALASWAPPVINRQ